MKNVLTFFTNEAFKNTYRPLEKQNVEEVDRVK